MKAQLILLVGFLMVIAAGYAAVRAQTPAPPTPPDTAPAAIALPATADYYRWMGDAFRAQYSLQSQSAQLAQKYVKAEKEDEKKAIRQQMTDVLTKEFDIHVQHQQKELADLEAQIAKLKETLKKRQDAKNAIVDRRIEQLLQEAQGLGWSAPSSPGHGFFSGPHAGHLMGGSNVTPAPKKP
jgi:hypothetical protein